MKIIKKLIKKYLIIKDDTIKSILQEISDINNLS